jgi:UDPglucose 6-dehydrogenase
MRLAVIGLGKFGSALAAAFASRGHRVIGVDLNVEYVRLLRSGKAPVREPGLQELIDGHSGTVLQAEHGRGGGERWHRPRHAAV